MQKKPSKTQIMGIIMIISSALIILKIAFLSIVLIPHGLEDVGLYGLLPYLTLSFLQFLFIIFIIYSGIRYIKNRPFAQNKPMGLLLILLGIIYFLYEFISVLYNNISGFNPGGELRPIIAFVWGLIFISIGAGLMARFPPDTTLDRDRGRE